MIRRFSTQWHVLPPAQLAIWTELLPLAQSGFVLYGGTAIALRLGHRTSVDFDFFTEQHLDHAQLRAAVRILRTGTTLQESADTLTILTDAGANEPGVKLSLFGSIDIGRIGEPECTDDGALQVASRDDLLATKLKVLLQRVEAKDYRDVAALLDAGADLAQGLADARTLFGSTFQPSEALKALTWFQGGDLAELQPSERATLIEASRSVRDLPEVRLASGTLGIQPPATR